MDVVREATRTGATPNVSDAFTINGQPGDLLKCSSNGSFFIALPYSYLFVFEHCLLATIRPVYNNRLCLVDFIKITRYFSAYFVEVQVPL